MRTRQSERTTRSGTRTTRASSQSIGAKPTKITKPQPPAPSSTRARTKKKTDLSLLLEQYRKQETTDTNASSILFKQPRELFALIISHLDPQWLVCLSLTCKLALQYIGTDCWRSENVRKRTLHSRKSLLENLVYDAPKGLSYCPFCNTLHPPLKPPRLHRETKLTKICMSQWAIANYFIQVRDDAQDTGYSLLHPHIEAVFQARETESALSLLEGNYETASNPFFSYAFTSSASWIENRLVLKHTHAFRPPARETLSIPKLLSLPLRLCPHLSTLTSSPEKGLYLKGQTLNSPLLTHALVSAFPPAHRTGAPKASAFRSPTSSEAKQMEMADAGGDVTWRCRGCTTKFKVGTGEGGSLEMTAWYCFGDLLHVGRYWEWLVRREVANLGKGKRNSEYWFPAGRSIPDFAVE
ncbi:hypothetical protein GRF29_185g1274675 [Pseudopithomyces chartarum]|uniref:F-box domain-containing protein n=1 Tax=Pseudopithomyces chartarum TaxID=1892770 RepID=A0AAN6LPP6_9PLEO|nr:hypothetical protein GRF29_185g1274675 [Pseudopithomyces chartarum]